MIEFIKANLGTIVVSLLIAIVSNNTLYAVAERKTSPFCSGCSGCAKRNMELQRERQNSIIT